LKNRIREYRKQRGWTIRDLAVQVGTSDATISRLETHQLSMSTDWLLKFADVFDVHPADLLEQAERPPVRLVGSVDAAGALAPALDRFIDFPAPGENTVAVRLTGAHPPFAEGDYLFGRQLAEGERARAVGRYCFAQTEAGRLVIGRLIDAGGRAAPAVVADGAPEAAPHLLIVPAESAAPVPADQAIWIAAVQMRVNLFEEDRASPARPDRPREKEAAQVDD